MAPYIDLLRRRFPTRQFTMYANNPRTLVAEDGGPVPSLSLIHISEPTRPY
jgi:hypothetical protein